MAEKYRWMEKLSRHPLFQTVLECKDKEKPSTEARNVLAEREGELFVWVSAKSRIFTTNLKNVLFENERDDKYQVSLLDCSSGFASITLVMTRNILYNYFAVARN